jgi:serine protease Do
MGLEETGAAVAAVAGRVGPAVVGLGAGWGRGSGVVVAPGRVMTVAHALRGPEPALTLGDGRRVTGRLLAADPDRDVAIVEADTGEIRPVEWRPDDAGLAIGRPVVALADPGGSGLRATPGFVASLGRRFRGPRGRWIRGAIEHTAPLPRGSAGGPLVDLEGRLIGVNTVRVEGGLILAAPADADLADRVERLGRGEAPVTRRLGVAVAPPRAARRMRQAVGLPERDGLLVRQVEDDGAAARAGVAAGDLIVAADGRPVEGTESIHAALDALGAGEDLVLTVVRATEERQVRVAFDAPAARG